MTRYIQMSLVALMLTSTGCITGPMRSAVAGKCQSATVEWLWLSDWYYSPIVAPAGLVADVLLIPGDTVVKIADNGFVT